MMKVKSSIPFLLLLILLPGLFFSEVHAVGLTYYVSPADSIQSAVDKAQPGDTIYLLPGVYYQDVVSKKDGSADLPITIKGQADAIVKGGGKSRIFEINHDYVILGGFTIDGLYSDPTLISGYRDKLIYIVGTRNKDGVLGSKVINMTLKNAGGECVRIKYFSKENEVASNNISNCGIYDFKFGGAKNGEGVYVGTAPEQLSRNPTPDLDNSDNNHIHNNIIDTQGNEGVDIKEGSRGNIIEYNKIMGQKDPNSAGLDSRGDGNVFRYNEVSGSLGAGLRFGGDLYNGYQFGKDNEAYGNNIHDNQYGAFKIQVMPQEKICGNILANNGSGLGTYGSQYDSSVPCGVPAVPVCETLADENGDGIISNSEIMNYLRDWKSGTASSANILKAINLWKVGVGC